MTDAHAILRERLVRSGLAPANRWLDEALAGIVTAENPSAALAVPYALALRRFGRGPLPEPQPPLPSACGPLPLTGWTLGATARVALLLGACAARPEQRLTLVEGAWRDGDGGEQSDLLRALALFDVDGDLNGIALDATRTNNVTLFTALAHANPYPAARFDEHDFNHLVLKALFIGVALDPVVGLRERANPDLSRMCEDYVEERLAAARDVPVDIWLVLAPHAGPRGIAQLVRHLGDPDPAHRLHAVTGCSWRDAPHDDLHAALVARRDTESDPAILDLLTAAVG